MEDMKSNATAEPGRLQNKPSAGASNNGRIDGASAYMCAQGSYFEGDYVNVAACPTFTVQHHHSAIPVTF
jgi:hypothetical protein